MRSVLRPPPQDLIVSLDADTLAPQGYLQSLVAAFARHPAACGISARYFHPLTEDEAVTRAMLGYENTQRPMTWGPPHLPPLVIFSFSAAIAVRSMRTVPASPPTKAQSHNSMGFPRRASGEVPLSVSCAAPPALGVRCEKTVKSE